MHHVNIAICLTNINKYPVDIDLDELKEKKEGKSTRSCSRNLSQRKIAPVNIAFLEKQTRKCSKNRQKSCFEHP